MKKQVILLLFMFQVIAIKAQITETKTGPIINGYGQSFLFSKYNLNDISKNINISLAALTALVEFQNKGYQIINFN